MQSRGHTSSPDCAKCPCARDGKPIKAVAAFGTTGGLCVVGEAPGTNELLQGYPFIGESGKVLTQACKAAGIDRGLLWITNALLCKRPVDDDAFALAVECCRPRLRMDLAHGQPKAICALGGVALQALQVPVTFVSQARGTVQFSPLAPTVPTIGSIHPAALLRGGAGEMTQGGKQKMNVDAQAMFLFSDVEKAYKVATGQVPALWSDDIQVVHEANEVASVMHGLLADIYEWGCLGLDLEWLCDGSKNALDALGADAHRAQITWVGVGCGKRAVSFKWEALIADYNERGMEFPDGSGVEESGIMQLQAAMEDETLFKLCHNKQADKAVWEAQVGPIIGPRDPNMPFRRHFDSMLAHHAAFPGIDHALQQVSSQFLCVPPWKTDHAKAIAAHKAAEREAAKVEKAAEQERKKAERVAAHERQNAEKAADAAAKKAKRQADHEANNAKLKADKKARKAAEKAEREQLKLRGVG